jgi:hypothetical protein
MHNKEFQNTQTSRTLSLVRPWVREPKQVAHME